MISIFPNCSNAQDKITTESYFGRWSLYLPGGAGWLEVHQEEGYLDASLLWYGGSVVPVDNVYFDDDALVVTQVSRVIRNRDEAGEAVRTHILTNIYQFSLVNQDELKGTATFVRRNGSGVNKTEFTAKRIPDLPAKPDFTKIQYGKPIELFNGKDLSGWQLMEKERQNGFKAENGVLINDPVQKEGQPHISYGNLRTTDEFEDFNLKLEVNIPEGNNSGIYLRGIYEVQVLDSYGQPLDSHNMGAIYSRITPTVAAEKPAGEWQALDITLYKRYVTVVLNGTKIIDCQPLLGVTGGAISADEFNRGPIYLQGDHGKVMYRNIVLTPVVE
ncbi:MAG: glycosyl hydrolase [Bacteroides sp. SM23_62_1]|nr:MAG: glycosyl hydrolase [Bacteroides sp. SM23_62_1]